MKNNVTQTFVGVDISKNNIFETTQPGDVNPGPIEK